MVMEYRVNIRKKQLISCLNLPRILKSKASPFILLIYYSWIAIQLLYLTRWLNNWSASDQKQLTPTLSSAQTDTLCHWVVFYNSTSELWTCKQSTHQLAGGNKTACVEFCLLCHCKNCIRLFLQSNYARFFLFLWKLHMVFIQLPNQVLTFSEQLLPSSEYLPMWILCCYLVCNSTAESQANHNMHQLNCCCSAPKQLLPYFESATSWERREWEAFNCYN